MPAISEQEKLRRRQSNQDVLGTHAMEGIFPDAATLALMDRFAEGELSREELSYAIDLHVQGLLAARGHLVSAS
jgi:hypothetical protein